MKLDAIDAAIIDLLRQNGRMSNREVGRALQISEGTVRQRLKKLSCFGSPLFTATDPPERHVLIVLARLSLEGNPPIFRAR